MGAGVQSEEGGHDLGLAGTGGRGMDSAGQGGA